MAQNDKSTGRHLLTESDMVAVVDGDKNEVGSVPKHWSQDQLAEGLTKTNRKPKAPADAPAGAPTDEGGDDGGKPAA